MTPEPTSPPARTGRSFAVLHGALVVILLAWLVFFARREDYWGDEGFTVRRVQAEWAQVYNPLSRPGSILSDPFNTLNVIDLNPPLYPVLVRALAGPHPSRLALRLFSIVPMIAALMMIGLWTRRRYGAQAAMLVSVVFVLSPAVVYYGHEARAYAPAVMWITMLIILFDRRGTRPRALCAGNALLTLAAIATHYHVVWLIAALIAAYAVRALRTRSRRLRVRALAGLSGILLGIIAAGPVLWIGVLSSRIGRDLPSQAIDPFTVLKTIFAAFMPQNVSNGYYFLLLMACIVLFVAISIWSIVKARRLEPWLFLWLAPAIGPMLARAATGQPFYERYGIFGLPASMFFLGWMIRRVETGSRAMRSALAALMICLIAGGCLWAALHSRAPLRPPWRPTIETLFAVEKPGDYYAIEPRWLAHAFAANAERAPQSTYCDLQKHVPAGAKTIWIIEQVKPGVPIAKQLQDAGWKISVVNRDVVYWLWRAER